jgi:hypothetical protein
MSDMLKDGKKGQFLGPFEAMPEIESAFRRL